MRWGFGIGRLYIGVGVIGIRRGVAGLDVVVVLFGGIATTGILFAGFTETMTIPATDWKESVRKNLCVSE